jgi:high-affinity Fe2+/Pb2+ permease
MVISDELLRAIAGAILLALAIVELICKISNQTIEQIMMMLAGFLVAGALLKKTQ